MFLSCQQYLKYSPLEVEEHLANLQQAQTTLMLAASKGVTARTADLRDPRMSLRGDEISTAPPPPLTQNTLNLVKHKCHLCVILRTRAYSI